VITKADIGQPGSQCNHDQVSLPQEAARASEAVPQFGAGSGNRYDIVPHCTYVWRATLTLIHAEP
jgi:hypothetical protein